MGLPPTPTPWLDELRPLVLGHQAENLQVLDVSGCGNITDAVVGIVRYAPRLQTLLLSRCVLSTDRAVESVCDVAGV
jgi:F-box and leucine-rich repeat protein GRR1